MSDDEAPGWDAIDAALRTRYGPEEPRHVGYTPGLAFGSGLQGCSAFLHGDHWLYVSYGLTELWAKEEGVDPSTSGWGYELTMRVAAPAGEPPAWPYRLLEAIARSTQQGGKPFLVGDRLDPGGPITGAAGTRLTAIAFTDDTDLPPVVSPNGAFAFRQLVGITADELAEMRATTTDAVLDRLRAADPRLVTDEGR